MERLVVIVRSQEGTNQQETEIEFDIDMLQINFTQHVDEKVSHIRDVIHEHLLELGYF